MPNNIKVEIEVLLKDLSDTERIHILDKLLMKYRKRNSVNMNARQYGRKVDIRPDEINLKG